MRDIVWTIIVIWLVYKLIDLFKAAGANRSKQQQGAAHPGSGSPQQPDLRKAVRKHVNEAGDYVDFEDIK